MALPNIKKRNGNVVKFNIQEIEEKLTEIIKKDIVIKGQSTFNKENIYIKNVNIAVIISELKTQISNVNEISASKINNIIINVCRTLSFKMGEGYDILAKRLYVENLHRRTPNCFSEYIKRCYYNVDKISGKPNPLVKKAIKTFVDKYYKYLDAIVDPELDYIHNLDALVMLEDKYYSPLSSGKCERPQYRYMLMACANWYQKVNDEKDIDIYIKDSYLIRAHNKFIPGSPAIYNAGTDDIVETLNHNTAGQDEKREDGNLSSCFLMTPADNSRSLSELTKDIAFISKRGGGLGVSLNLMRERGALLKSSGGTSNGVVEFIKILEKVIDYYRQPRRSGSIAVYLDVYHPEFVELLQARRDEVLHKIFIGCNIRDVLLERALKGLPWYFFSNQHPANEILYNSYGKTFTDAYNKLCENGAPTAHRNSFKDDGKTPKYTAMQIVDYLAECIQIKSVPYLLNMDVYNEHSNQKNLGLIRCSNLCTEIILYSDEHQYACCIIGTINVATFYDEDTKQFDWDDYIKSVGIATRYLDAMIDATGYPVYKTEISNKMHRPIALGIQGFADLMIKMGIEFGSKECRDMNIKLFESLYYHSIEESMKLAIHNGPYKSFRAGQTGIDPITKVNYKWSDSPTSQGQLHPFYYPNAKFSGRYDFKALAKNVQIKGLRNSQCIGNAPTASTSVITGVTECVEPIFNHITLRRLDNKDLIVVNKYLLRQLTDMKRNDIIEQLREGKCDLQQTDLPQSFKNVFKTWHDIHPAVYQQMMIDRAPFIDQSISNNHYLLNDIDNKINPLQTIKNLMFNAYRSRIKTISYYFRQDVSAKNKQNFKQL